MTQELLSRYRDLLQAKLIELQGSGHSRDDITVLTSADSLEEVQYKLDRDLAALSLNRESSIERGIATALRRIQQGTFGTCINCREDISRRRLEAVPWTLLCIDCQQAGEAGELEYAGQSFPDAA
jgi:DnaK suppressor protein